MFIASVQYKNKQPRKGPCNFYDCFSNKKYTLDSFFCSFDQFHSTQYCFLISFCLIELVLLYSHQISSNLRCNLVFMLTMINWSTEEIINANVYRHSLSMAVSQTRFHRSFEWHLTPLSFMTLPIETCIRQTPCIKRTLEHFPRVSA